MYEGQSSERQPAAHSKLTGAAFCLQILTSGHDTGTIEILYSEETLAELWANSAAAREEFPDHPDVVRRAVSLCCKLLSLSVEKSTGEGEFAYSYLQLCMKRLKRQPFARVDLAASLCCKRNKTASWALCRRRGSYLGSGYSEDMQHDTEVSLLWRVSRQLKYEKFPVTSMKLCPTLERQTSHASAHTRT